MNVSPHVIHLCKFNAFLESENAENFFDEYVNSMAKLSDVCFFAVVLIGAIGSQWG